MGNDFYHNYTPGSVGLKNGNIFGLPFNFENSKLVLFPVPWDVTVSYRKGASYGPAAILEASPQLDFYDKKFPEKWKEGIYMLPISDDIQLKSKWLREKSEVCIKHQEEGTYEENKQLCADITKEVNEGCRELKEWVFFETSKLLDKGKLVGVIGGDHSVPLGFIEALASRYTDFGVLQIDAHADLRKAYEAFTFSHASVMAHVINIKQLTKLVQVGIRDICDEEVKVIKGNKDIITFFDQALKEEQYQGKTWDTQCEEIISHLPQNVYLSVDIDGLNPSLCPNTGTPVPGGLAYGQLVYLIKKLNVSGKKIIGFDLCEVAPGHDDWDGNVGARMLYQLCVNTL